ncbi:hydrogenase formation protein HypD [Marinobacterium sediminicola]|uniref:Hydrogenase maturation factor n=1 Tax=Marinobacterium sediminicola TaxID=518898 RepID=A0ABY1RXI6_9GAMM|nr:hydrogenase formation protein HypD [Marinobacterium sediminicola]ULG67764.1 hydrogenase formation protein HypD [Marinobacterium sediminicola]SMR71586.1 Hydrogenase maturation protein HypD [Marinobacterium sediminicola]
MRYVDEFRDPLLARQLLDRIAQRMRSPSLKARLPVRIMEVCGGHTHSIFRYGLESLLPEGIELIHGPGCPVCVLPRERVDDCLAIAAQPDVIFATFGDAMRVPGTQKSLQQARSEGLDIRMVYSPLDALELARKNPSRRIVFFGLGFETTMPSTALTLKQAADEGVSNFFLLCHHITIVPTLKALLDDGDVALDGFIGPGHVSMVIGLEPYAFIARQFQKPFIVSGFEPLDILQSILILLEQLANTEARVENQYTRVVQPAGNRQAQAAVAEVFELRERFVWRGLGEIEHSGVRIRPAYAAFDAERVFDLPAGRGEQGEDVHCGQVLKGLLHPHQCPLFGKVCTPSTPIGALMVSSEGACSACYQYKRTEVL